MSWSISEIKEKISRARSADTDEEKADEKPVTPVYSRTGGSNPGLMFAGDQAKS